jgi:hypothetical protein
MILALATLAVAAVGFSIYVDELVRGGPPRLLVPVFERIAAMLLLAWMVASATNHRALMGSRGSQVPQVPDL